MAPASPTSSGRWLLRPPMADAAARVFCLPYSGVGASMYARWPARLGDVEICPVQPPGRENRLHEAHYGTFDNLGDQLSDYLVPYLSRPFAFFGHCSSALAGYATNQHLIAKGHPSASCLFISSQVPPDRPPYGRFLQMGDAELGRELRTLVRAMGGEPDEALIELGLEVMRQDIAAHKNHPVAPAAPVPSAITVIGWDRDAEIPPDLMRGWKSYGSSVRFVTLSGTHHTFLDAPMALLAEISAELRGYQDSR